MIVLSKSKYNSVQDVFDAAKSSGGKLKLGHSGMWGATMVPMAQLLSWGKVTANLTPYKGGGPMVKGLLSGDVEAVLHFPSVIKGQGSKVKTLGCGAKEKSLGTPPTFDELGFTGQIGYMDRILMAPAKTPAERIKVLQEALAKLKGDKTFKKFMGRLGENMEFMNGPDYEKIRSEKSNNYKSLVKQMTKG